MTRRVALTNVPLTPSSVPRMPIGILPSVVVKMTIVRMTGMNAGLWVAILAVIMM